MTTNQTPVMEINFNKIGEANTAQLVSIYNQVTGSNIKKGSYTRAKMIKVILEHKPEEPAGETIKCPGCGASDPAHHLAVGDASNSFMSQIRNCSECDTNFHCITGEKAIAPTLKKRRKLLNPQNQINKKKDVLADVGVELLYDKNGRDWTFLDNGRVFHRMASKTLANYTSEALVRKIAPKKED